MKIAIVGYDVEGQASYRYYSAMGDNEIVIFDEADTPHATPPEGVEVISGSEALDTLKSMTFDMVIRTPGLSPKKLEGVKNVTTATREFFKACPAQIVGVTGTKGKGTVASLIHSILEAAGKKNWLVGNIGAPALDILKDVQPDDVVIYELSSFQLWDLDISPHIAVVLMIEPDHLDVHESYHDYIHAKENIRRFQKAGDKCYYDPTSPTSLEIAVQRDNDELIGTSDTFGERATSEVCVLQNTFFIQDHPLCPTDALRLVGRHNLINACAAISVALNYTKDYAAIERGIRSFEGLPHRLKFVREVAGVKYYDDSIATTPGSAIAAINSFEQPKVMILGGSDKGADFSKLYEAVHTGNVKQVIAIGHMGERIADDLMARGYINVTHLEKTNMTEIVKMADSFAISGDVVIMSPACASFDMFTSYNDRGEQFVTAVEALDH